MVRIFKNYSSEKGRTTPVLSVDGKAVGFLSSRDARNIAYLCTPVDMARYSNGTSVQRHFLLTIYRSELLVITYFTHQGVANGLQG